MLIKCTIKNCGFNDMCCYQYPVDYDHWKFRARIFSKGLIRRCSETEDDKGIVWFCTWFDTHGEIFSCAGFFVIVEDN